MPLPPPLTTAEIDALTDSDRNRHILKLIDVACIADAIQLGHWHIIHRLKEKDQIRRYHLILSILPPEVTANWPNESQVTQILDITDPDRRALEYQHHDFNPHLAGVDVDMLTKVVAGLRVISVTTMHQLAMVPVEVILHITKEAIVGSSLDPELHQRAITTFKLLMVKVTNYTLLYNSLVDFIPELVRTELKQA